MKDCPEYKPRYFNNYAELPHLVSFSGGRSSGMMLFTLLENEVLKPERGDVVIFNNTSAEHPETYLFVERCRKEVLKRGIPFFILQFQTYQAWKKGLARRIPSYRLVKAERSPPSPDGYDWKGGAYREYVSFKAYLPNRMRRVCTQKLKIEPVGIFMRDWLTAGYLPFQGDESKLDVEALYELHLKRKGKQNFEEFVAWRRFCWSRPRHRPPQNFAEYGPRRAHELRESGDYISFIGLRADEPARLRRMPCGGRENLKNEVTRIAPLGDLGVDKNQVIDWWGKQDFDLGLPVDGSLGNCTFCFLKGIGQMRKAITHLKRPGAMDHPVFGDLRGTPTDIEWWKELDSAFTNRGGGFWRPGENRYEKAEGRGYVADSLFEEPFECFCAD